MILLSLIFLFRLLLVNTLLTIDKSLLKNEICSYNGTPIIKKNNNGNEAIECKCKKEYTTYELSRTILNNPIYCSYEKKSRLTALYLSIALPFGFNYFYLGRIGEFIAILLFSLIVVIGNAYIFALNERKKNLDNEVDYKRSRNPISIVFIVLAAIWVVYNIINVSLVGAGIITDVNGIETFDDVSNLMNDVLVKDD